MRTRCAGRSSKSPLARHGRTAIASERGAPANPIVNAPGSMRTSRMPTELVISFGWAAAAGASIQTAATNGRNRAFIRLPDEAQGQLHDPRVARLIDDALENG